MDLQTQHFFVCQLQAQEIINRMSDFEIKLICRHIITGMLFTRINPDGEITKTFEQLISQAGVNIRQYID